MDIQLIFQEAREFEIEGPDQARAHFYATRVGGGYGDTAGCVLYRGTFQVGHILDKWGSFESNLHIDQTPLLEVSPEVTFNDALRLRAALKRADEWFAECALRIYRSDT